jgi:hypothetical protein
MPACEALDRFHKSNRTAAIVAGLDSIAQPLEWGEERIVQPLFFLGFGQKHTGKSIFIVSQQILQDVVPTPVETAGDI